MTEKAILMDIANALKSGDVYGEMIHGTNSAMPEPFFWEVLSYGKCRVSGRPLWKWRNYGESANPATLKDLEWIIRKIFKTTPSAFVAKYTRKIARELAA